MRDRVLVLRPGDELDPSWELTGTAQLTEIVLAIQHAIDTRDQPLRGHPGAPFSR